LTQESRVFENGGFDEIEDCPNVIHIEVEDGEASVSIESERLDAAALSGSAFHVSLRHHPIKPPERKAGRAYWL
jgi:hypothetical protein